MDLTGREECGELFVVGLGMLIRVVDGCWGFLDCYIFIRAQGCFV